MNIPSAWPPRSRHRWIAVPAGLLIVAAAWAGPDPVRNAWERRWVYVSSNLYVDANMPKLQALLNRAGRADYNGVLFTDYKTFTWWELDAAERWARNARRTALSPEDRR